MSGKLFVFWIFVFVSVEVVNVLGWVFSCCEGSLVSYQASYPGAFLVFVVVAGLKGTCGFMCCVGEIPGSLPRKSILHRVRFTAVRAWTSRSKVPATWSWRTEGVSVWSRDLLGLERPQRPPPSFVDGWKAIVDLSWPVPSVIKAGGCGEKIWKNQILMKFDVSMLVRSLTSIPYHLYRVEKFRKLVNKDSFKQDLGMTGGEHFFCHYMASTQPVSIWNTQHLKPWNHRKPWKTDRHP